MRSPVFPPSKIMTAPIPNLLRFCALSIALGLPARLCPAATEAERNIRVPGNRNQPYIDPVPDSDYHHASEAAYDAFRDMKYAVRIHWGIYADAGFAHESWPFLGLSNEEKQRYNQLYKTWNPQGFDAEQWMKFFDQAGFHGLAFTAKHHEGFSMFDTRTRVHSRVNWTAPGGPALEDCDLAYSIMETPFHRDIVKEICDAAHRHGLMIDLYFSHPDWYDADFRPYGTNPAQVEGSDTLAALVKRQNGRPAAMFPPVTAAEQDRMMARHREQLRELLSNYGKIDMVCLDISLGAKVWPQMKETIKQLRAIQPDAMFRDRGIGNYGDYYTPEQFVPSGKEPTGMPWMVIYPLGSGFSFDPEAGNYKGAKWIVNNLVDSVAKGGNFMVGIGPDKDGRFHPTAVAQITEAGDWIRANAEAIYGTRERPGELWKEGADVRFTRTKDQRFVYAICLSRPAGTLLLKTVSARPNSDVVLLGGGAVPWRQTADGLEVTMPADAPAALAYAFKIQTGL
jgi:alpha-L-fucosidase